MACIVGSGGQCASPSHNREVAGDYILEELVFSKWVSHRYSMLPMIWWFGQFIRGKESFVFAFKYHVGQPHGHSF